MRILVVDDHIDLITNIFAFFDQKEYILDAAQDVTTALRLCEDNHYDIIILDWMLPKISGLDFLTQLRAEGATTPVIMLTAKTDLSDKLQGFAAGSDDYLTKPFSLEELEARIIALHNRSIGKKTILEVADLQFNILTNEVFRQSEAIHLYAAERKILALLMRESPNIVTKERLEFTLWGDNPPDKDLLRMHMYELRKKIDAKFPTKLLKTRHKIGYQIIDDAVA